MRNYETTVLKNLFLFLSGAFAQGALGHLVLALQRLPYSHYGVNVGVSGNWIWMAIDSAIAILLFVLWRKYRD